MNNIHLIQHNVFCYWQFRKWGVLDSDNSTADPGQRKTTRGV